MNKRMVLLLALLLPLCARAEVLDFQVKDMLSIRAEVPDAPEALPEIETKAHAFDVGRAARAFDAGRGDPGGFRRSRHIAGAG